MKLRSFLCAALCATSLLAVGCGGEDDTFVNTQAIQNAQNQQNTGGGQTANGSTFNLTFNNTGGANALVTPFSVQGQADFAGFRVNNDQTKTFQLTQGLTGSQVGTRTVVVTVADSDGITAGEEYTFGTDENPTVGAWAEYSELISLPQQMSGRWTTTGGTVRVTSVSSNSISVELVNAAFSPAADGNANGSGSFTVSGTATVNE